MFLSATGRPLLMCANCRGKVSSQKIMPGRYLTAGQQRERERLKRTAQPLHELDPRPQQTEENQYYARWIGNMSYERALHGSIDLPPEVEVMYSQNAFLHHIYPIHEIQRVDDRTTFFGDAPFCAPATMPPPKSTT
jgi:hypothetical protein